MDEIIPRLWIGDLPSALDVENLKAHGIYSIVSAMRGRITIHETFIRHQILLDDTEDADVLTHFLPSIHFIKAELGKGRGVLVHCQAGISRSSTIVAAYLMYTQNMDPASALQSIRKMRPNIDPNPGFLRQLEIFHQSRFRISTQDKNIRMFYLDRTVDEVMNGDGSAPETEMFAKFPRTPSDSMPNTPREPRRRIRCKMCRQELAAREHMLDHGQLGPATPASLTPATSRRSSATINAHPSASRSRAGSSSNPKHHRLSNLSFGDVLIMSAMDPGNPAGGDGGSGNGATQPALSVSPPSSLDNLRSISKGLLGSDLSVSALETEDADEEVTAAHEPFPNKTPIISDVAPSDISIQAAELLGHELSAAVKSSPATESSNPPFSSEVKFPDVEEKGLGGDAAHPATSGQTRTTTVAAAHTTHLVDPSDLSSQLYNNPKLAALRTPPTTTAVSYNSALSKPSAVTNAPIIANPKCSGYFVEPMKWMEPFLQSGQLAGKILCPNKKCGAKLGNYDWAGVCCGCKQWVTPGFCINRSKVDEIII